MRDTRRLDRWQPFIAEASLRFAIPQAWIRAVMHLESDGLTSLNGAPITSSAGAMGLMQLMPDTWRDMRDRYALGSDPYDPHANILAGTAYLREMYDHYGYPNLFAAYNAGPERLNTVLSGIELLPRETKAYIERIIPGSALIQSTGSKNTSKTVKQMANSRRNSPQNDLFFVRADAKILSEEASTDSNYSENLPSQNTSNSMKTSQPREAPSNLLFVPLAQTAR